jgi:catechol 2,3-dioxygenase-like lactoylglutathione lyase family enzyme
MPPDPHRARMSHAGMAVGNLEASLRFYRDVLGFREFWRGSSDGKTLSWVNLRAPEGDDYIELMLYGAKPDSWAPPHPQPPLPRGSRRECAWATLAARALPAGCKATNPIRTGVNRKRQINCYDPDGTRVEVMEANTVDGLPAPPSSAPPPASVGP